MWLSFDMCSSYAWSKIIKRGYPLGETTAGQRLPGSEALGDREQHRTLPGSGTWQQM